MKNFFGKVSWACVLLALAGLVPIAEAASAAKDCSGFVQDLKHKQASFSAKQYRPEADGLYVPPGLCAPAPMQMILESADRTEVRFVEQCRKTGYKVLTTSVICIADPEEPKPRIHVGCQMGRKSFSPCLKKNLESLTS